VSTTITVSAAARFGGMTTNVVADVSAPTTKIPAHSRPPMILIV
jgi:hypothetical protein